ncbi:hypothetical protein RJ639_039655 [Escallonia herrerae]|uniref:Protein DETOXIFICATION n=1 Tax=Escallonia herrerae TaxID=1293975 RepID=A0AA89B877_9ASTE|nr:hypothetical protein RJ639_039655 [Escallonia herrerae]
MDEEINQPLLKHSSSNVIVHYKVAKGAEEDLKTRVWIESRKLWHIVGPSIFSRVASGSMNIVTQAFAGQLGDVELASISIANTVILGFNFGLLLGMASALETLCGQAFGAKRYHLLGVYMQRSWIVLFLCSFLLLPVYVYATPVLKVLGQPDEVAEQSGLVALWFLPIHFSFAFQCPLQRFLQSQLKTGVLVWVSLVAILVHVLISWLFVYQFEFGVVGLAIALDISWWVLVFGMLGYTVLGGCPDTWTGFSVQAFSGLWDFLKLSASSGVMLWYNAYQCLYSLDIRLDIRVRVANELGAGNGKAAKFATKVSVVHSTLIGLLFCVLIMVFHDKLAVIFSSSTQVREAVDKFSYLLAFTILFNSVQPVLSGVAVGSGWQAWVAYVNLGCYYLIGIPIGIVMGLVFNLGVEGVWGGMIFGGTAVQTGILAIITIHRDWEKEAERATMHIEKLSSGPSPDYLLIKP